MKVEMLKSAVVKTYNEQNLSYLSENKEYEVPQYQAERLIAQGYAKSANKISEFFYQRGV